MNLLAFTAIYLVFLFRKSIKFQMNSNNLSSPIKNKLYSKPKRASKMVPLETMFDASDGFKRDNISSETKPTRIKVKKTTAFGFQNASFQLALERKKADSNRYYKGQQVPVTVDPQHFKIYGPGIYLFFSFLWKLSLLFLVLTLISLVPIIYNYVQGSRFSNSVSSLGVYISQVSISNFYGDNPLQTTAEQISSTRVPKLVNCICDLVSTFLVMVFYFYWTGQSQKITDDIKKSFKLPNYQTLELKDFPEDASDLDVYNFFNKFGMVTEVAPVKNYSQTIELSKEIYDFEVELKELKLEEAEDSSVNNKQQIKEIEKKVAKLYSELVKQELKSKQEIIKYYVSFSTPLERTNTLKRFKKVYDTWCIGCKTVPQDFKLKGNIVTVQACHDQPGEIIWENVHVTWKTRWIRALIQFIVLLAIVFVGFFVISTLDVLTAPSTLQSVDTSAYTSSSILIQTNLTIVQSWCLKNTAISTSTSSLSTTCSPYITLYYINLSITYIIAVFVILIKTLLKKLVIFIAKFQRYKQHTQQSIDIMKNLVIIYIITTVVIGFLLQANFFGVEFKLIIPDLLNNTTLKTNANLLSDYSSLENSWYVDIGYQIWLTWAILAISPHSYMPLYHYLMEWLNEKFAKGQKLQKNMDKALQTSEFEIQDHYANIIMIFVVGLAFSGGMPCIIIVSFVGIITRYLYLKFLFIRFSRVPKSIDEHLNATVLSYFPWALLIHFLMTIWMYSVPAIFAQEESYFSNLYSLTGSSIIQFISKVLDMLIVSYYYTIVAVVIMLCVLVKEVIYDFVVTVCRKEQDGREEGNPQDSANELVGVNFTSQRGITNSYRIENNPDYFEILSIKQKMKAKIENSQLDQQDQKQKI